MEKDTSEEAYFVMPDPIDWFTKLIFLQADLIYNCLVCLFSPILCLLSLLHHSYHRAEEAKDSVESAVQKVPSTITYGTALLLKKVTLGFLGAAYVCMVLIVVLVVAVMLGVGLVQLWVEDPVFVRESLYFDYTEVYPEAVFSLRNVGVERVPGGHTIHVSLVLLMPESDFNREIGVFQLTAELLSANGAVIAKSSQPCMLRFRSLPIQLARTFLLGIPLLLGISGETQTITIEILKHKEGTPRTEAVRVTLVPRAGTSSPPQLYEAEILIHSQLPWAKQLVRSWKWTLYVWMSLYIYIMFLVVLVCCYRPLILPMTAVNFSDRSEEELSTVDEPIEPQGGRGRDERELSDFIRKWRRSRSKRKRIFLQEARTETIGSSASSMSVTREDTSAGVEEEDVGDSESVCLG